MKTFAKLLFVFLLCSLETPLLHAQNLVVVERPISGRALAGHVLIGNGLENPQSLEGVTVELCTPDWQSVLASTKTDKSGHFNLDKPQKGNLFYLRFRANNLKILQIRVRIKRLGPKELTIFMENAV